MIVVSDASPILNLARIGEAGPLCRLYGEILIPNVVVAELTRNGVEPRSVPCLMVRNPVDYSVVMRLQAELDASESAAIALALEVHAEVLLADERKGRRRAVEMGLSVVGLLGVISEAKRRGLIVACRPILDALQQKARFWISDSLRERFLELNQE